MAKYPNDYISRQELIEFANNSRCGIDANDIARFPASDVRENKRGSWMTDSDGLFICSECEEHAPQRMVFHPQPFYWTCDVQLTNFCPNCGAELIPKKLRGADMRGGGTCNGDSCTL